LPAICSYKQDNIGAFERGVGSFQTVDQYDLEKTREKHACTWPGTLWPKHEWPIEEIKS
jgi:hypothetical protein